MNIYHLFGLTLASDYAFANPLLAGNGAVDVTFTCCARAPLVLDRQTSPAYTSPHRTDEGKSAACLYRLEECDVLCFAGLADFYLWPRDIVCHPVDPVGKPLIEIYLLGTVLAFWLERQDIPALHASAVVAGQYALAFLSNNKGGKSSLAAALMQAGCHLLTDDLLPVELRDGVLFGRPGYPAMRMWPDEAQHFWGDYEHLDLVHPDLDKRRVPVGPDRLGAFCDAPRPLACIYLPQRRDPAQWGAGIDIIPLSLREAIIELVRHSFLPRIVQALGWQSSRLDFFARLLKQAPMRRLLYPSGFQYLPAVRQAILDDVERLAAGERSRQMSG